MVSCHFRISFPTKNFRSDYVLMPDKLKTYLRLFRAFWILQFWIENVGLYFFNFKMLSISNDSFESPKIIYHYSMCFYCFFHYLLVIYTWFYYIWGSEHGVQSIFFFGFVFVFVETSLVGSVWLFIINFLLILKKCLFSECVYVFMYILVSLSIYTYVCVCIEISK